MRRVLGACVGATLCVGRTCGSVLATARALGTAVEGDGDGSRDGVEPSGGRARRRSAARGVTVGTSVGRAVVGCSVSVGLGEGNGDGTDDGRSMSKVSAALLSLADTAASTAPPLGAARARASGRSEGIFVTLIWGRRSALASASALGDRRRRPSTTSWIGDGADVAWASGTPPSAPTSDASARPSAPVRAPPPRAKLASSWCWPHRLRRRSRMVENGFLESEMTPDVEHRQPLDLRKPAFALSADRA